MKTTLDLSEYPTEYHNALRLLIPIWRGLDSMYKSRYARNIWQQFEDNIRSAAYTHSIHRFLSSLCSKLEIRIETRDLQDVLDSLAAPEEDDLLHRLREETTVLVLMVRLENEKRKAEWKAAWDAQRAAQAAEPELGEESERTLFDE